MKTHLYRVLLIILSMILFSCQKQAQNRSFDLSLPQSSGVVTKVSLTSEQIEFVHNGNQLAFRLLDSVYDGSSVFFSPLGVQISLGIAMNGASDVAVNEISEVLGYGKGGKEEVNLFFRTLMEQLPFVDSKVTLRIVNAIIANTSLSFNEAFKLALATNYYAPAQEFSFANQSNTLDLLNSWASRNTDGKINPLLSSISDDAGAFLLNALYFKAPWKMSNSKPLFNPDLTKKNIFYSFDGEYTLPFMAASDKLPYADMGNYTMLSIPFSKSKFCMTIILPKDESEDSLNDIIHSMTINDWRTTFTSLKDNKVVLMMPKYRIEGDYDFKSSLQELCVKEIFSGNSISRMFVDLESKAFTDIQINSFKQKTCLQVEEWGTEASAVTYSEMDESSDSGDEGHKPIMFIANHPFVFLITEKQSGIILFEGVFTGR